MTTDQILSRLKGVKKTKNGWDACCPVHQDAKASLGIAEGDDGRVLLCCRAGCSTANVLVALGLQFSDLSPARSDNKATGQRQIVQTYDYTDESGQLLFQCVRYMPKDFKQRRPDPAQPGQWIWSVKGVRLVLYRLPEVKAGLAEGSTIFTNEGEKDCDRMLKEGFVATCNPMGADEYGKKWLPDFTEALRGASCVVVIADKDNPNPKTGVCKGQAFAAAVARALHPAVKQVKLVELPDRGDKPVKDASDWFNAGGTAEELRAIVAATPAFDPQAVRPTPAENPETSEGQTPNAWFKSRYSQLVEPYGEPVREDQGKKSELPRVMDVSEDFMAATLSEQGCPDAPTIFLPTEERFYTYEHQNGVFVHKRESDLSLRLSGKYLECARACKLSCDTSKLEFGLRDTAALAGILRRARGLLAVQDDFFNHATVEYIPVANGMLRLSDRALLPFSPTYRCRNKLAAPYEPDADCPIFLNTLMRPALDEEDVGMIQRWFGLALLGVNLAQVILLLMGAAGSGKGTTVRVCSGVIGENNLAALRTGLLGERFELGRFLGRTLLYGADVPDDFLSQRSASVLKSLTGGDPMTVEFKNSNEQPNVVGRYNVLITSNSRLTVHLEGDTDAWRRRLCIVRYSRPRPAKVIADLSGLILREESPGVLCWMLDGLDQLREDGWQLRLSTRQQSIVDDLLLESDGYREFVRRRMVRDTTATLLRKDVYAAYVDFCSELGWVALNQNRFGARISDAVIQEHAIPTRNDVKDSAGKNQQGWKGLRLISPVQSSDEIVSEVSESTPKTPISESSESFFPLHCSVKTGFDVPLDPATTKQAEPEEALI